MQLFWEILSVFFLSSFMLIKAGVVAALALGFPFFKAVTVTSLGGISGAAFYVFLCDKIISTLKKRKSLKQKEERTPKKIFTTQNRLIVKIKGRLGLIGIAVVTPFFSYPFGCYIAVRYYQKDKQKILIYVFASTLFWSILSFSYKLFF